MLAALALLIVPVLRDLPLGQSTRTGLLAWLLVVEGDGPARPWIPPHFR
jgi:hypothetical protein